MQELQGDRPPPPHDALNDHTPPAMQAFHPKDEQPRVQKWPDWFPNKQQAVKQTDTFFSPASTTSKPRTQQNMDQFGLPKLTKKQRGLFNRRIAMHFYTTDTPFARVENKYLREAFDSCRPGVKLSNRHNLGDDLLNLCFGDIKGSVDVTLANNIKPVCVVECT